MATRPLFPPVPGLVPLQATGQETFFANGTLTGLESFSYGGTIFRRGQAQRYLHGRYTVVAKSQAVARFDPPKANELQPERGKIG